MKRLRIFILLILSSFCLLTMPVEAKALDFGNFAGDEDFSYDSNRQVEETTAAHYAGAASDSSDDDSDSRCGDCGGCIITTDTFDWAISNITALSQQKK